jgi:excisionase family DNA binding protein
MAEIDPRRQLWERASEALHAHGYQWPLGPYPDVRNFSVFVARQAAGHAAPTPEACVQIVLGGEYLRIRIKAALGTALQSETARNAKHKSFIAIAKQVIANLKTSTSVLGKVSRDVTSASLESGAEPDENVSTTEAASMLFVSRLQVVKLIDEGLLPLHHQVGKHRFVRKADVLAYKERKRAEAKAWLDSQTEDTDPSGQ